MEIHREDEIDPRRIWQRAGFPFATQTRAALGRANSPLPAGTGAVTELKTPALAGPPLRDRVYRRPVTTRRRRPLLARVNAVAVLLVAVDVIAWLVAARIAGATVPQALLAGTILAGARVAGRVHRRRLWLSWLQDLPRSVGTSLLAFVVITCLVALTGPVESGMTSLHRLVLEFAVLSEAMRPWVFAFGRWGRRRLRRCDRAIVVGAGDSGGDLIRTMLRHPEFGLLPVGFVPSGPIAKTSALPVEVIRDGLAEAIVRHGAGTVVLAHAGEDDSSAVDAAVTAHRLGCVTLVLPRLFALCPDRLGVDRIRSYPLMRLAGSPTRRPSWLLKRVIEAVLAAVALVVLAPVIASCAVAVLLESGFPVIFRQVRVGVDGRTFLLYKLRSVRQETVDDSATRWSVAGDHRVGPVGRFLRKSSLDELPQLWNVVRGDMVLVGPRPERPVFVEEFSAVHDLYWARHRVPTGLTGLAQVHGLRGDTSIADRARYDNYYIANWSLWLDLKIIILTMGELFCRRRR
ncbi:exopolysaccharide biosynthesis polyprenyl glycosylphosphotransferase [Amycolatopsis sp. QT-25]|uniref:exopolysaccharide biosynthesis polyprenyl glycosylphosphotransferase n=1 Tax=Amycolatopsis sp. QT-25 TaxID=3034022 RepID=UPI0023EACEFF|nr:exopolysaccharide biosynthesis polyprenyl glycosylphosphotransferase [Amycolatopsis sp. QT-25]WET81007.1 exopolysaccharide biosynthesis polyprenyl glycosylphosphotransferase [Amycolatopsis sp. QT-25]